MKVPLPLLASNSVVANLKSLSSFLNFFLSSNFRNKFEDKGRFVSYLKTIPVYIIKRENLGLLGAAKKLNEVIRA